MTEIISANLELENDFSTVSPIAVNSSIVSSFSGDIVIDCLFIDPFTFGKKANALNPKGFGENSSELKKPLKVKALPMARLALSPSSAIVLMEQIQQILDQLGVPYNKKPERKEIVEKS